MSVRSRLIGHAVLAAVVAVGGAVVSSATADASARVTVCRDSNGSRPGGSVYWAVDVPMSCDVTPDQRLHLLRVADRVTCDDMGGHGWTPRHPICWDVDF